jgi:membrane associated rhomboid family serine protease
LRHFLKSFYKPFQFVILLWGVFYFEVFTGRDLSYLGVYPRTEVGLLGILFAPLLHGGLVHLVSNTIPLLILGTTLYFFYPKAAARIFFLSYFGTNILVWIFARPSFHIGASGIVYGIAFFLFFIGFFRKDFISVAISIITIFFYGGIVFGMLPGQEMVSWETHLMGALVGFGCAFYFRRPRWVRGW